MTEAVHPELGLSIALFQYYTLLPIALTCSTEHPFLVIFISVNNSKYSSV